MFMIHNVCILQIFIRPSQARFDGQVELKRSSKALTGWGFNFLRGLVESRGNEHLQGGRELHCVASCISPH